VPFSKSTPGRNPLQRLSDQRRSLALAGLAAGAVFSAAIFRRKRRGVQAELREPIPGVERSAEQPESGPPAAVAVPTPASEPEPVTETAINATQAPAAGATESSSSERATAPLAAPKAPKTSEPATGELSAEEASILAVLAQSGRTDDDRTALAVATSLERQTTDVAGVLRKLGAEGVVSGELYTAAGDKIWAVTERGVRRLGAQS
jgi:hypothetical protein